MIMKLPNIASMINVYITIDMYLFLMVFIRY